MSRHLRTLVVHCHPDETSFNAALYRAACEALEGAGHEVRRFDLYAGGFEPVLTREERRSYLGDPGAIERKVQAHVDALRWAEHLVFVFPTWFYGPPAVLKGWLERVWLPGVAFEPSDAKGKPPAALLRHITHLTVVTTSGSPWWWLKVMGDPGRKLFVRGLRALFARGCRTTWLQLYDMNNVTREDTSRFLAKVSRTLGAIR